MLSEPPLVGRDEQLSQLNSMLRQVVSGSGGLILISGEAGAGKTRLATEFERHAEDAGCKVLFGCCLPTAGIPYLVFLDALNDLFIDASDKKTSRTSRLTYATKKAVPEFMNAVPVVGDILKATAVLFSEFKGIKGESDIGKEHVLFKTLDLVKTASAKRPLIIHLDDLQWADSMSIEMLHFLARNCRDLRVLLLGTYRSEEVLNKEKGVHPFLESLRVMKRESLCSELHLEPLRPSEIKDIVPAMLEGRVTHEVLDAVANESRGNPLYAVEVIRLLASNGLIELQGGIWKLREKGKIPIPSSIKEVIIRRTEHVPKDERRILEYASIIGEWFDPELFEEIMDTNRMRVLECLEVLDSDLGLVREVGQLYKFSHERIRQVVYEQISSHRRKELHRSVGLALEKKFPDDDLLGQLSYHFDKADENGKCIKYSLLAGQHCSRRKAIREAKSYYQLVLSMTVREKGLVADRLQALEGLGDAGREGGMTPKERYSYYEQFLRLNEDPKAKARVLVKSAECWDQFGLGDVDMAMAFLNEAESCLEIEPLDLAMCELSKASLLYNDKRFDESLEPLAKAMVFFRETGNSFGFLEGMHMEVGILAWTYRLDEARDLARKRYDEARKLGAPDIMMGSVIQLSHICLRKGEIDSAIKYSSQGLELARKLGFDHWLEEALIVRARAEELNGDFEPARRDVMESLYSARASESPIHIVTAFIDLALYESELGLLNQAEEHYGEAKKEFTKLSEESRRWSEVDLSILHATILLAKGSVHESYQLFEEAIKTSNEQGMSLDSLNALLRYAVSLANRGNQKEGQIQLNAAMSVAGRIGCVKRVQLFAKRAGISIEVN